MPTFTTNYSLALPLVNNATDQDLWGGYLNTDLSSIDTLLRAGITNAVQSTQTTSFSASASISIRYLYPCDATSGAITATLPAAATAGNGATVIFQKTDSTANAVTLARAGSDTINGATSYSMTDRYDVLAAVSDGVSAWVLIVKPPVAPIVYPTITGFIPSSIAGTSTTATLTISSGFASDSTRTIAISNASTTSWAVSNGNAANGYSGGSTLPNSSTIHFFMILKSDGTTPASFASTSLTPTLPSGYSGGYYRRIFSLRTSAAGALLNMAVTEVSGGGIRCAYTSLITDYSSTISPTASLISLSTPGGIKIQHLGYYGVSTTNMNWLLTSPEDPDSSVSAGPGIPSTCANLGGYNNIQVGQSTMFLTNTSSQLRARSDDSTGTGTITIITAGWIDFRASS